MNATDLMLLFTVVAPQMPLILLTLVGLILARSRLLPSGSASVLATLGFAVLLVHAVVQLGFQIYLMHHSARDMLDILAAWSIGGQVLSLAGLICLSCAIFAGRRRIES
jgi:hypothetical protein